MKSTFQLLIVFLFACSSHTHAQKIETYAGIGYSGNTGDGSLATLAKIDSPLRSATDIAGNVYFTGGPYVRKISTAGIITTIAGNGVYGYSGDGGQATAAALHAPCGIAVDSLGNVYFTDAYNCCIRKINTSGIITTVAGTGTPGYTGDGGPATAAELSSPFGLAVDRSGNIYVTDVTNNVLRKIDAAGIITTIAGTGVAASTGDGGPATAAETTAFGVSTDNSGNIYIAENNSQRVRKIDAAGIISTIAGNGITGHTGDGGPATAASLNGPTSTSSDSKGNLYITEFDNFVRKVDAGGVITTIAGTGVAGYNGDGIAATTAKLFDPLGVSVDGNGKIYFCDDYNYRIRTIAAVAAVKEVNEIIGFNLYPNPNNGEFTFKLSSNVNEDARVVITSMAGEKIKEITTTTNKLTALQLDAPSGVYLVNATTTNGKWSGKVMLEH